MTQYFARVENDHVAEIIELPDGLKPGVDVFHEDVAATLRPCDASITRGQVVNADGTFGPAPPPPASIKAPPSGKDIVAALVAAKVLTQEQADAILAA